MLSKFLGKNTTIGLYQVIYEETRKLIRGDAYGCPFSDKSDEQLGDDIEDFGAQDVVKVLEDDSASVYVTYTDFGPRYDHISVKVKKSSPGTKKISMFIKFSWKMDNREFRSLIDEVNEFMMRGTERLNKKLKASLRAIFNDSLIDDRFLVQVKRSLHYFGNAPKEGMLSTNVISDFAVVKTPLIVQHELLIVDERAVRPEGRETKKVKARFNKQQTKK